MLPAKNTLSYKGLPLLSKACSLLFTFTPNLAKRWLPKTFLSDLSSTETGESIVILKIVSYTLSGVDAMPFPIIPPVAIIKLSAVYSVSKAPAILLWSAITLLHFPFSMTAL